MHSRKLLYGDVTPNILSTLDEDMCNIKPQPSMLIQMRPRVQRSVISLSSETPA